MNIVGTLFHFFVKQILSHFEEFLTYSNSLNKKIKSKKSSVEFIASCFDLEMPWSDSSVLWDILNFDPPEKTVTTMNRFLLLDDSDAGHQELRKGLGKPVCSINVM